ncbi:hypothetical protein Tco_1192877 [Tanacetum coccineum]
MLPKRATRSTPVTTTPAPTATTTTSVTNAQLQAMIDQGVTAALAARDANRNGDDSHTSGTGGRRTERVVRECTYQDFMKCKPLYFKGTEGVVELRNLRIQCIRVSSDSTLMKMYREIQIPSEDGIRPCCSDFPLLLLSVLISAYRGLTSCPRCIWCTSGCDESLGECGGVAGGVQQKGDCVQSGVSPADD